MKNFNFTTSLQCLLMTFLHIRVKNYFKILLIGSFLEAFLLSNVFSQDIKSEKKTW